MKQRDGMGIPAYRNMDERQPTVPKGVNFLVAANEHPADTGAHLSQPLLERLAPWEPAGA